MITILTQRVTPNIWVATLNDKVTAVLKSNFKTISQKLSLY